MRERYLMCRHQASCVVVAALLAFVSTAALAVEVEVFHADSLAGPMRALKGAFEAKQPGTVLKLTSGVSKELAERILKGEACDVFAPSAPSVINDDLMEKPIAGSSRLAATWYVVFSANEMVIVTAKGNPLGIRKAVDLAKPGVRFVRINGEKDLATPRTLEFLKRAATLEGSTPELAGKIADSAVGEPGKVMNVPGVIEAVAKGQADASVVYYSAAVAARNDVEIVRFPASVNLSDSIRNAATVPGTARNPAEALQFVRFILSPEGQEILRQTGQPPLEPAIRQGAVPAELR
jgi:molybdate transport system substrate-binding protein